MGRESEARRRERLSAINRELAAMAADFQRLYEQTR